MHGMEQINKTALVTGGARRIGKAIVQTLHSAGYNVMIHCNRSLSEAEQLCALLNAQRDHSASVVVAELLDMDAFDSVVTQTISQFKSLDVLVNNASTFYPTKLATIDQAAWTDLIGSNLKAPLFLAKAAAPALQSSAGSIINIIDIYAQRPLANHTIYCAAKAGLEMLTKSLARDLAPVVRVNGVAPGAILWPENEDHPLDAAELVKTIPMRRLGDPSDIAQTVLFLATQAPYITGQLIAVDGGRSIVP